VLEAVEYVEPDADIEGDLLDVDDRETVGLSVKLRVCSGDRVFVIEDVDDLDGFVDLVLVIDTNAVNVAELENDGDRELEIDHVEVFVKNLFDSELQGLAEGLPVFDGDDVNE